MVAIVTSDKIVFKPKAVIRNKEGHYIISLPREYNISLPREYNNYKYICSKYQIPRNIKQILTDMKGEIKNTLIIEDSVSLFKQWTDHSDRKCWI